MLEGERAAIRQAQKPFVELKGVPHDWDLRGRGVGGGNAGFRHHSLGGPVSGGAGRQDVDKLGIDRPKTGSTPP